MAHMMLFFELMRVKREYNAESRKQISITQKMDRMQKQIDRTTKYYTSLFTQLENQAKCMQNNANMYFQSMTGGYNFNGNDYTGISGLSQFIPNILKNGQYTDEDGKAQKYGLTTDEYQTIAAKYQQFGSSFKDSNGKSVLGSLEGKQAQFFQANSAASQMQSQVKTAVAQMSSMFQNGVSSWLECQKASLEAEQEQTLDALNYEETMMECDQTASKVRMEELKAEKESLQEELKERVQDDAPGFGL